MSATWQWFKDKFGRIITWLGGMSMVFDLIPQDISPVTEYLKDLVGQKVLSVIALACFMISFGRHQQIANRVQKFEQQGGTLPK